MDIAEITVALVAGVTLSLFFAEKTGIVPAGLVVPGYIALVVATPVYAISILFISFATYLVVMHVINRFTILYGRRKFAAMLLTGIILKLGFDTFFGFTPQEVAHLQAIGLIVPGLIANTIQRQGFVATMASTALLSLTTFGILLVYQLFFM
ncbi:poly-gamma-glutamate biosynthesis protein PgsC [Geomicrobium sediminis]|uniref:Poly-gamma-glutamate biosynthesis protein PgsC/CapC n=1 Tax=Geomicrobium sediminis TaxID=1347788 RepID=A0ABS2PG36_9BACL|nr:poly-gamma-glutamate biosynthesis protein PgsC [Geomicrobium sediminis]MBM7634398.1 poly-gamma-glutamate biosynthesis protein PgsC/CapC [Geomicrobium sediminis]GAJ99603.1 LOW QUALITY PROTEIN: poly-gamma-glutamate synthase subunit PgsC/CapC [Geomicrobium sp. JCM 19055]